MKPARIALLLQLCLLAGAAVTQSPEQEIEAEAQKLLPTLFSQYGDDYFSKRMFKHKSGTAYVKGQYKGVTARVTSQMVTKRDAAHGVGMAYTLPFYTRNMKMPARDEDMVQ